MGMAYDAFRIEECTCLLSVNHGPGFRRGRFLEVLHRCILVHSKGLLQHLAHFEQLFKRLHKIIMKIHPKKCEFVVTSVVYLRHRILPNGIMTH